MFYTLFQAAVLGLVQGLGEFLPISSSAHLVLVPWLFRWPDQGLSFDIALHLGTLTAVIVYYWRDIIMLIKAFVASLFPSSRNWQDNNQRLAWLILLATIPGAIFGKVFEQDVETIFRSPLLIAGTLSVMGLILFVADYYGKKQQSLADMRWWQSLAVGLSQALALIPGVSRSGATITTGLSLGFTRADAARFSFLMSIPIIAGAGLLKAPELLYTTNWAPVIVGFVVAALTGFAAIVFMLRYISHRSLALFTWYRLVLAALIVLVYVIRT
jgi:undecaprenyl-diphosphatase